MNESHEVTLVRRCQAGDKEAFRILVEQYRNMLFGTAYLMIRDRGLAEDAMQEVLIQMWKHLPSLRLRSSFKAWLVRIVVNEVKQQFRGKQILTVPLEPASEVTDDIDKVETARFSFLLFYSPLKIALDHSTSPSQALYGLGVEAPGGVDKHYRCNIGYCECSEGK